MSFVNPFISYTFTNVTPSVNTDVTPNANVHSSSSNAMASASYPSSGAFLPYVAHACGAHHTHRSHSHGSYTHGSHSHACSHSHKRCWSNEAQNSGGAAPHPSYRYNAHHHAFHHKEPSNAASDPSKNFLGVLVYALLPHDMDLGQKGHVFDPMQGMFGSTGNFLKTADQLFNSANTLLGVDGSFFSSMGNVAQAENKYLGLNSPKADTWNDKPIHAHKYINR